MIVLQLISLQATYAFASSEILTQERIFSLSETPLKKTVTHDAIHDMEAFFWVMTYICITRQGPGGDRRDDLKPEGNAPKQLLLTNYYLFSSDEVHDLVHNKRRMFTMDECEEYALQVFHPYFNSLKPLMRKWWKILRPVQSACL